MVATHGATGEKDEQRHRQTRWEDTTNSEREYSDTAGEEAEVIHMVNKEARLISKEVTTGLEGGATVT